MRSYEKCTIKIIPIAAADVITASDGATDNLGAMKESWGRFKDEVDV